MKYVNKEACVEQKAVQNVIEEVELLREVDHPFVVSLWYTFQVKLKHVLFSYYFMFIYLSYINKHNDNHLIFLIG